MKKIHALTIIDKSSSMNPYRSRTIEGINTNILALKKEVDADTVILNTQLQFSCEDGAAWRFTQSQAKAIGVPETPMNEKDFVFTRIGESVVDIPDMVEKDYSPIGWTPLLDAIGYGIEKVKSFHGDDLGNDDLKIIVTIFTDGEENASRRWTHEDIKRQIQHFSTDDKFTFTFVGCGGIDDVNATASGLGISAANTVAYAATDSGYAEGFSKVATSYSNFARSAKLGKIDKDLFTEKATPTDK